MEKIFAQGLRGIIDEAEASIERFAETKGRDIDKVYFWQAAIIVCEAMVAYSRRYAELARDLAVKGKQPRQGREIADICDLRAPGADLHEALQCLNIIMVGKATMSLQSDAWTSILAYLENDLETSRITWRGRPNW
jgi:pyruvate-formate lyase